MSPEQKAEKARTEFLKDFNDLLKKHKVEIEVRNHCVGYSESGTNIITAYIDAIWDDKGNRIQDQIEIEFGTDIVPNGTQF